jgi:hypothetical protein
MHYKNNICECITFTIAYVPEYVQHCGMKQFKKSNIALN